MAWAHRSRYDAHLRLPVAVVFPRRQYRHRQQLFFATGPGFGYSQQVVREIDVLGR